MTRDEIEQILQYDPEENQRLYMPNEIFYDLPEAFSNSSPHLAFAYSYYYLISYLYRFCKYGGVNGRTYYTSTLKEILGYSGEYKRLNAIIKKSGTLDEIGYTMSSTDYPITWRLDEYDGLVFYTYDELSPDMKAFFHREYGNTPRIKVPLKGLDRDCHMYSGAGTFYCFEHTTRIPVEVFLTCMPSKDLGCIGFYLYSWLKCMCTYFGGNHSMSRKVLAEDSGIKFTRLVETLAALEAHNMIRVEHRQIRSGLPNSQRQANKYAVNDWREFTEVKVN